MAERSSTPNDIQVGDLVCVARACCQDHQERRELFAKMISSVLRGMYPNVAGGKYSGQQVAYAKGRAWQEMRLIGF